jgi:asparagine synthase (glutamine-hydrolysing)
VFAVDHSIARYGVGRRTFRTATAVAMRRDRTVWNVLATALQRRIFGLSMAEYRRMLSPVGRLVHVDVTNLRPTVDHFPNPWFSASRIVPMETVLRLGTIAFAPSFYDLTTVPAHAAPYVVSPLCAQPVFEVAARIPVDIHFDGGRARGLARRAFVREVPEAILRRQWKDRPLLQMAEVIQRNLNFVREALLDGALVKERILNREAVELALQIGPSKSTAVSSEILRHLDLELWIRQGL